MSSFDSDSESVVGIWSSSSSNTVPPPQDALSSGSSPPPNPWCTSYVPWLCLGVTKSLHQSEGGRDCYEFTSLGDRGLEIVMCLAMTYFQFKWAAAERIRRRESAVADSGRDDLSLEPNRVQWKPAILLVYSLIFGIEIGFKTASKQLIYLLNPCHVTTCIQLFLLTVSPMPFVRTLFRIHVNLLPGALLAMVFPVTASREFTFEVQVYWIQHILMLAVPVYLLSLGGPFTLEPLKDLSLCVATLSVMFLYHFCFLQPVGMLLEVNLNQMLCPAPSDPFYGRHYRKFAMVHQSLYVPLFSRLFCALWYAVEPILGPRNIQSNSHHDWNSSRKMVNGDGDFHVTKLKGA